MGLGSSESYRTLIPNVSGKKVRMQKQEKCEGAAEKLSSICGFRVSFDLLNCSPQVNRLPHLPAMWLGLHLPSIPAIS